MSTRKDSHPTEAETIRFWAKVDKSGPAVSAALGPCWLWTASTNQKGYGHLYVGGSLRSVHRVSWQLETGAAPGRAHVLHRCDVPACVRPDHLFLGTNDDNVRDKIAKGRQPRGELAGLAKLTETQVLAIRERIAAGEPPRALAAEFGVEPHAISRVASGLRWAHVGGPVNHRRRAKLTPGQASDLKRRAAAGENRYELAALFGVSRSHVDNIAIGRKWKNHGDEESAPEGQSEVIE